ncbi:hypothetical protein LTR78_002711 [Recurvomyces mirabilis]|uniref:CCHC-type domain-containing protein n=1 Tax=Recurvomyces mirabilis TaxID=574656 RepID=A0AAE0WSF6_9PEZI|nr:hypothetical protein LTR78_002711 [Recurvomyces mirabilis]KAK5159555.1 hypothetical protein LTS14_002697 [Recurvomyces mirabilis]
MPLTTTLRRISVSAALRRSSKASVETTRIEDKIEAESKDAKQDAVKPPVILSLPTELWAQIFTSLSFKDICSIRLTCKDGYGLASEGDILREWAHTEDHIGAHLLRLFPCTPPIRLDYVANQLKRKDITSDTAARYTAYIYKNVIRVSLSRVIPHFSETKIRCDFVFVAARMQQRMIPLLQTLQHYLESLATIIVKLSEQRASQPGSRALHLSYAEAEQKLLSSYDPEHLSQVYRLWCFMTWMSNQIHNRPSYAGGFERAVRGWLVDPMQSAELDLALVLGGGLRVVRESLRLNTFKDRRSMLERRMKQLRPDSNVRWEEAWKKNGMVSPRRDVASRALQTTVEPGQVFASGARAVLLEAGMMSRDSSAFVGTVDQCTEFLRDMAGYDLLHVLPPEQLPDEESGDGLDDERERDTEGRDRCLNCERYGHQAGDCPDAVR